MRLKFFCSILNTSIVEKRLVTDYLRDIVLQLKLQFGLRGLFDIANQNHIAIRHSVKI